MLTGARRLVTLRNNRDGEFDHLRPYDYYVTTARLLVVWIYQPDEDQRQLESCFWVPIVLLLIL